MKLRAYLVCILVVVVCFLISAAISFGQTPGTCAEQVSPYSFNFPNNMETPAINDLGEIVWTQFDPLTNKIQLNSSFRGQIATDSSMPTSPSINNRGDMLWTEGNILGIISGKKILVDVAGISFPVINDNQEIVAVRYSPSGLYSTYRGQLTNDETAISPAMNNKGDIVWAQYDLTTGTNQIYGIISGVQKQVTTDSAWHSSPSINDAGEIVWLQPDDMGPGSIYSNVRGRLSTDCLPNVWFSNTSVNNCGDVVATGFDPNVGSAVYRIGNASPCGNTPEPNNDLQTAVLLTSDKTTTGVLDPVSNTTDWYRFTAKAGDPIKISVNWGAGNIQQDQIDIALLDANGMPIATAGGLTSPSILDAVAPYAGTYYIRLDTLSDRYGYGLYLKVGIGSGLCADPAITADTLEYTGSDSQTYSMDALGEIIWSKYDMATGQSQIFSSVRGQLTFDMVSHEQASSNNRGDLVWIQNGQVYGILSGTPVQLTNGPEYYGQPAINDLQEVVAIQYGNSGASLYSTRRGILIGPIADMRSLSLNNKGDVVWAQFDDITGMQIYGLISGVLTQLTTDSVWHSHPSINDAGEVVWSQMQNSSPGMRIFSNVRGQMTHDCPYSADGLAEHMAPVINSCGDLAYIGMQDGQWLLYRLGSASPCVPDALSFIAQVDSPLNAGMVSNSIIVTGLTAATSITIIGGEYEINSSGLWTSANGKITNGDSVRVRIISSDKGSTTTEANLIIGGGLGTFRVTTRADVPPPTVVMTSPISGLTNNNKPLLMYTASAGAVIVTVDGAVVSKVSGDTLDALADGMHTISISATDSSGRTGSASVTFTVDTIAPSVWITSPVDLTNNNTPLLIYTVSDGTVVVKVDGVVVNKVSGSMLDPLADGIHMIRVEATDAAGNSGFAEATFTIDTVPLAISIDPVISPTKHTTVTISGTRDEGATVTVTVDTSAVVELISYPTASTWSCEISRMVNGINAITATASDVAGNTATTSKSIMVEDAHVSGNYVR